MRHGVRKLHPRMEVDDIIKHLAWAAKLYGGSRRKRESDQGSRARDWEIEDHDMVTAEIWGSAGASPERTLNLLLISLAS